MAKKKKRQQVKSKDFSNSPFKDLKGLSALKSSGPESGRPETKNSPPASQKDALEKDRSFSAEKSFLGVRPLEKNDLSEPDDGAPGVAESLDQPMVKNDEEMFLDALGSLDQVFIDECPDETSVRSATPRRMKQLERGSLQIQDQLDLHGLTVDEAKSKVTFFLNRAKSNGLNTVLVITGKGLHSADGPVIRQAVERLLSNLNALVVEWGAAPVRYGGRGAIVVFVRQQKKNEKMPDNSD